jgi:hypothetical protein
MAKYIEYYDKNSVEYFNSKLEKNAYLSEIESIFRFLSECNIKNNILKQLSSKIKSIEPFVITLKDLKLEYKTSAYERFIKEKDKDRKLFEKKVDKIFETIIKRRYRYE